MSALPNFLFLGAPRTGSTGLHHALRERPDFFLPRGKETHFFSGRDASVDAFNELNLTHRVVETIADYRAHFDGAENCPHRGEIDPSILSHASHAVPAIQRYLGAETQFIIVLRQPVERAFSHYRLHLGLGIDRVGSFPGYARVATPQTPLEHIAYTRYFCFSYYADSLLRFFKAFARERFLVRLYEDLQRDPQAFLRTVLEFLRADTHTIPTLMPETNAGLVPATSWSRLHAENHGLRRWIRRFVPAGVRAQLRRRVRFDERAAAGMTKPTLDPALGAELTLRYRDDILQTQDLIGRDLSHWL